MPKKRLSLKKEVVFFCSCCATVLLLILSAVNVARTASDSRVLGTHSETGPLEEGQLSGEISFWHDFLQQTPSYVDGWLELATLQIQSGNKSEAMAALEKAKEIDPNSEKLKTIEESLPLAFPH